jgi:protein-S-isoprenylcysteine O-methyltransferase Ste14
MKRGGDERSKLLVSTGIALTLLPAMLGLVVFVPAGTVYYWQGWVFLVTWVVGILTITVDLMRNDQGLLSRRLRRKEIRQVQIWTIAVVKFLFGAQVVFSAWNGHKTGGTLPAGVVLAGDGAVIVALWMMYAVMKANRYAGATIQVDEGQTISDKGPYAMVRHPYYTAICLVFIAIPVALGSVLGLIFAVPLAGAFVVRLLDEERMLVDELPGYADYLRRVPYRLVPRIW